MFNIMKEGFCLYAGKAAIDMEALRDEDVKQGVQQVLNKFPGVPMPKGVCSRIPKAVVHTRWGSDPFFRGSYSYLRWAWGSDL